MTRLANLVSDLEKIALELKGSTDTSYIEEGDRARIQAKRGLTYEGTIVNVRMKARGAGYDIAFTSDDGKDFKWPSKDGKYDNRICTFISRGGGADAAKDQWLDRQDARAEKKQDLAADGAAILHKLDLQPGDKITINYRDVGPMVETVVDVNYKTGKVGIKRFKSNSYTNYSKDDLYELWGLFRKRAPRDTRWIHANNIGRVVERVKDTYDGDQRLPIRLSPQTEAAVESNGWHQVRAGNGEFIVGSYVIATVPALAREGTNYDGASKQVYRDPMSGYFWRSTGSFD